MVLALLVVALGLAVVAAGCGSDDDEAGGATTAAATTGPGSAATVPDVEGAELSGAAEQLAEAGLRAAVKYVPSSEPQRPGDRPVPAAGSELQRGDTVR